MREFIRRWRRNPAIEMFLTMTIVTAVACFCAARRSTSEAEPQYLLDFRCYTSGIFSAIFFGRFVQCLLNTKTEKPVE